MLYYTLRKLHSWFVLLLINLKTSNLRLSRCSCFCFSIPVRPSLGSIVFSNHGSRKDQSRVSFSFTSNQIRVHRRVKRAREPL